MVAAYRPGNSRKSSVGDREKILRPMHLKLTSILSIITLFLCLIPINSFAATTADGYYRQGCDYYEQEKFDEAAKSFKKAVELEPENATYHYNLGTTYCNLGKYEEALKHLERARELAPESQAGKYAKEQIGEIKKYLKEIEDENRFNQLEKQRKESEEKELERALEKAKKGDRTTQEPSKSLYLTATQFIERLSKYVTVEAMYQYPFASWRPYLLEVYGDLLHSSAKGYPPFTSGALEKIYRCEKIDVSHENPEASEAYAIGTLILRTKGFYESQRKIRLNLRKESGQWKVEQVLVMDAYGKWHDSNSLTPY